MGYPWYSTHIRNIGKNGLFGIIQEKNCDTKVIRYRADIIDPTSRSGKKSISSIDLNDLHNKVNDYLLKKNINLDGQKEDIRQVFEKEMSKQ